MVDTTGKGRNGDEGCAGMTDRDMVNRDVQSSVGIGKRVRSTHVQIMIRCFACTCSPCFACARTEQGRIEAWVGHTAFGRLALKSIAL